MALYRIVIDTCVVESALRSQLGASFQILKLINQARFRFGISVPLYLEYESRIEHLYNSRILTISKHAKDTVLKALAFYADEVSIFYRIRPNLKDENNNMVFECAVNYSAHYIVTQNATDFRTSDLASYAVDIITPQTFFREVLRG